MLTLFFTYVSLTQDNNGTPTEDLDYEYLLYSFAYDLTTAMCPFDETFHMDTIVGYTVSIEFVTLVDSLLGKLSPQYLMGCCLRPKSINANLCLRIPLSYHEFTNSIDGSLATFLP